jgi:hypothetical protein
MTGISWMYFKALALTMLPVTVRGRFIESNVFRLSLAGPVPV